jgi:hypothetical protein
VDFTGRRRHGRVYPPQFSRSFSIYRLYHQYVELFRATHILASFTHEVSIDTQQQSNSHIISNV